MAGRAAQRFLKNSGLARIAMRVTLTYALQMRFSPTGGCVAAKPANSNAPSEIFGADLGGCCGAI
jgi:hypothetical protein